MNHQSKVAQNKIKHWIMAARPKTLPASISPVILGIGISYLFTEINVIIAVITCVCAMLLQISTNIINDYFDYKKGIDTQNRVGPERVTSKGLLTENEVRWGYRFTLALAFILGIVLVWHGGVMIIIIGLLAMIFAYLYTAGPIPLSYIGLGELLAFIFFGPVAVWGSFWLQTKQLLFLPCLIGFGPGFISAAIMGINNLRDIDSDKQSAKLTLAILLGEKNMARLILLFILSANIIPVILAIHLRRPLLSLTCIAAVFFIHNWKRILNYQHKAELNNALALTGQYLFVYSSVFALSLFITAK